MTSATPTARVRTLLAHSSGMQSEPVGSWWERSAGLTFDELVAANDGSGAVFPAQQQFHYSNLGYALLGELAARLLGTSWWDGRPGPGAGPAGDVAHVVPSGRRGGTGLERAPLRGHAGPEPSHRHRSDGARRAGLGDDPRPRALCGFLLDGHPDVLSTAELGQAFGPQSGEPGRRPALGPRAGLPAARRGLRDPGRARRVDARLPGACLVDRRAPHRWGRARQRHHRLLARPSS